jgi:hypothetical protein
MNNVNFSPIPVQTGSGTADVGGVQGSPQALVSDERVWRAASSALPAVTPTLGNDGLGSPVPFSGSPLSIRSQNSAFAHVNPSSPNTTPVLTNVGNDSPRSDSASPTGSQSGDAGRTTPGIGDESVGSPIPAQIVHSRSSTPAHEDVSTTPNPSAADNPVTGAPDAVTDSSDSAPSAKEELKGFALIKDKCFSKKSGFGKVYGLAQCLFYLFANLFASSWVTKKLSE